MCKDIDVQFSPPHPGELLKTVYLDAVGCSYSAFSSVSGIPYRNLARLLTGQERFTPEICRKIGLATGTKSVMWERMQQRYDLVQDAGGLVDAP